MTHSFPRAWFSSSASGLARAGLVALLSAGLASLMVGASGGAPGLAVQDLYFRTRPVDPARGRSLEEVLVVEIDDHSVAADQLGRFASWPRTHLAEVVDYLSACGAAAVGLDLLLSEPDALFPQDDARLAEALARARNVVLAAVSRRQRVQGRDRLERLEPLPALAEGAAGLGLINLRGRGGDDRQARRYPFRPDWPGASHPSLAVAMLEVAGRPASGGPPGPLAWADPQREGRAEARSFVDVLAAARAWKAAGRRLADPEPLTADEASALGEALGLPGDASPAAVRRALSARLRRPDPGLEGRLVVVGPTATGLADLYESPFGLTAGPHVHAAALAQLLRGEDLLEPPWSSGFEALVAMAWALAAAWAAGNGPAALQLLVVPLALLAPVGLGCWLFAAAGLVVAPLAVSVAGGLAATLALADAAHRARRHRDEVRAVFGRFVSPEVVRLLVEDPARAAPGGELRELTVLTADVRGFTTLSEGLPPEVVTEFLNTWFEEAIDELWRHGATVDKLMGDGILAFFNAPLDQPDHPARAQRAAVGLVRRARRLAARLEGRGAPGGGFSIGVSLHTGTCLVGNLGARRVMGYTAIGDTVNTAARVEGLNGKLGSEILLTDATLMRAGPAPQGVQVVAAGDHPLKGKAHPVRLWRLEVDRPAAIELRRAA